MRTAQECNDCGFIMTSEKCCKNKKRIDKVWYSPDLNNLKIMTDEDCSKFENKQGMFIKVLKVNRLFQPYVWVDYYFILLLYWQSVNYREVHTVKNNIRGIQKMKEITEQELKSILKAHAAWLTSSDEGKRADFYECDLRGHVGDLRSADLSSADLNSADKVIIHPYVWLKQPINL